MSPDIIDLFLNRLLSSQGDDIVLTDLSINDWENLVQKAQSAGLAPLVYWTLSKSGKLSSLPGSARQALRFQYSSTWMQNKKRLKELVLLADLFNAAEIPVVVLKGACFALTIYPDIGLRPMGDLDVLVPVARMSGAVRIAKSIGYMDCVPEASLGLNDLLSHHARMQKAGNSPLVLEIHDTLVAEKSFTFSVPIDWFWKQTEPLISSVGSDYNNILMLTPTAQVLYACAHAMLQHGGKIAPLRWLYDIDLLIRTYPDRIDWDLLITQAKIFDWGSALGAALLKTIENFNTPISEGVREVLGKQVDRNTHLVENKNIRPATHIIEEYQKFRSLYGYAGFRFLIAIIAPAADYMRWRYSLTHGWQLPPAYLFRWLKIIKDAVYTLGHLIRNQKLWPFPRKPHP